MGTLALINFLWLLAITLKAAFELTRSSDPFISIAAIGLFGSLATCIIDMNFESYSFGPNVHHLWLLIAVIVGLNRFREIRSI